MLRYMNDKFLDKIKKEAKETGRDFYSLLASYVFEVNYSEVEEEQRAKVKSMVNLYFYKSK